MQCKICFNEDGASYEDFKTGQMVKVSLDENGLCHECIEYLTYKDVFLKTLKNTKVYVERILQENRGKYEYDAIFFLSGGKDSTAGLVKAVEKYQLNILAYHVDKGNAYIENGERIFNIVDRLGVDLVVQKVDKNLVRRLISFCFKAGLNPCLYCGIFVHRPVVDRFINKFDFPFLFNGVDLWEIQWSYFTKQLYKSEDPYSILRLRNNPLFKSNQYFPEKFKILKYLENKFVNKEDLVELKQEFLRIYQALERKYFLLQSEIVEIEQKPKLVIPITALEFEKKQEIIDLITEYGWRQSGHKLDTENTFTDCRVGAYSNYILPELKQRRLWSLRVRSGMVTKEEALAEMNGTVNPEDIKKIREEYDIPENLHVSPQLINKYKE